MTLIRPTLPVLIAFFFSTVAPATADEARARELVNALGCKGCHSLGENGGNLGPDLNTVGRRLDAEAIRRQIVNPRGSYAASMMPAYDHLPTDDLEALVDYLKSLR